MKYFHFVHIFIFFSVVTDSTAGFSGDDIRQEIISELKDYFGGEIETIKANHESEIKALKEELDDNNKGMKELKGELYNERRERIQAMLKLSKLSKKYSILQKETRDLRLQLDTVRHEQTKALDELRDELEVQKKTPSEEATDNQDSLKYSVEQQSVVPGFTQQSSMDLESLKHTGKPKAERKLIANHKVTKRQTSGVSGSRVAFFASLTNSMMHVDPNQDIVFDRAVTNVGNAYSNRHGTFVAPVSGIYVFSMSLLTSGQHTHGKLVKNGQLLARVNTNDWEQSSQLVVVELNKGDDVAVQNELTDITFLGNHYSTFSGFLLYDYTTSSEVVGK